MANEQQQNQPKASRNYERLEAIRKQIGDLRNQIKSLNAEDKLWEEWLSPSVGGLTCVLESSHNAVVEMKRHYRRCNPLKESISRIDEYYEN